MFLIGVENKPLYLVTVLACGALALGVGAYRCAKARLSPAKIALATAILPLAVMPASHLLYCLVDLGYTVNNGSLGYLLAFWGSGQMLYGGIIGALLALALIGGKDRLCMLEQYAPAGALMIAAARIGEGFMGQGYGEYFDEGVFFRRFPFMVYDPYYEEWAWALFMLEALVALLLFAYLMLRRATWQGDGALLLLGLFAAAQIVLESLRRDEFLRWGFVRVEQVASAVCVLAVLVLYCVRAGRGRTASKALCFSLYAMMIVFCLLLEFATEGRIPFLEFLDVNGCYTAMTAACAVLGGCVLWMRRICSINHSHNAKEPVTC